jgi:hypothetical protein
MEIEDIKEKLTTELDKLQTSFSQLQVETDELKRTFEKSQKESERDRNTNELVEKQSQIEISSLNYISNEFVIVSIEKASL